jgi:hypothetical protein
MNTHEYAQIREARLALMCVGDTIYYVSNIHRLITYTVHSIEGNGIRLDSGGLYHPLHFIDSIDTHEGNLYIFEDHTTRSYGMRLKKLISIIEANERRIRGN